MAARRFAAILLLSLPALFSRAGAQAVTGLGDDGTTAPAGTFRLRLESGWTYWDQQYVSPNGSSGNGTLRPLGAALTLDSLGATQLPFLLTPLRDLVRSLAGSNTLGISLGSTRAQASARINSIPLTLEAGVTHWFSISATVPIVRTRANVFFVANEGGATGNLGLTDGATLNTDTAFAGSVLRGATAVQTYCTGSGAGSAQCSGYAAQVVAARSFGTSARLVYGGSALIPLQGSTLQGTIATRAAALAAYVNSFAAISGSGVTGVPSTGLVGSTSPLSTADIQSILVDPSSGVSLAPIGTVTRTGIGDVEAVAKVKILDTFGDGSARRFAPTGLNARIALEGGYRFPTGSGMSSNVLYDIPTGTHTGALLARGYLDLGFGSHFWTTFAGRLTRSRSDSITIRYAPTTVLPAASNAMTLNRQLGDVVEIEATPRWVFNDFLSFGGQYTYGRKSADTYTSGTGSTLVSYGAAGEDTEQRVGGGVVFSNAHAVTMGRTSFPIDVSYLHTETIAGRGVVPKYITDQIMVRLYYRFLR